MPKKAAEIVECDSCFSSWQLGTEAAHNSTASLWLHRQGSSVAGHFFRQGCDSKRSALRFLSLQGKVLFSASEDAVLSS